MYTFLLYCEGVMYEVVYRSIRVLYVKKISHKKGSNDKNYVALREWSMMGSNIELPNLILQGVIHMRFRKSNIRQFFYRNTPNIHIHIKPIYACVLGIKYWTNKIKMCVEIKYRLKQ